MYVILVYDVNTETREGKRIIVKLMKKCREYLHHTQKSVFEGEISEAKMMQLKANIMNLINKETDYVVIYNLDNRNNLKRENIGKNFEPTANIL